MKNENFPAMLNHKPRFRAAVVIVATLAVMMLLVLAPKPKQHYPNVVVSSNTLEVEFLMHGHLDPGKCRAAVDTIASTMQANCPSCVLATRHCAVKLSREQRKLFSEEPIESFSARNDNGIIIYRGNTADAREACEAGRRKTRELNIIKNWSCHDAGTARPTSPEEKDRAKFGHGTFVALLYLIPLIMLILLGMVYRAYRLKLNWLRNQQADAKYPALELPSFPSTQKFLLAGVDLLILAGVFLAVAWPDDQALQRWSHVDRKLLIGEAFVILLTIGWFWVLLEHYARRRPFWDELREIMRVLAVMLLISAAIAFVAEIDTTRMHILLAGFLNMLLIPMGRVGARTLLNDLGIWKIPALIIGTGPNARDAWRAVCNEHSMGYKVLGFVTLENTTPATTLTIKDQALPVFPVDIIHHAPGSVQMIFAIENASGRAEQDLLRDLLSQSRNKVHLIPPLRGLPLHGTQATHFFSHEVLLLTARNNLARRSYKLIKRCFDVTCGGLLLLLLAPAFLYLTHLIRKDGAPAFYGHTRIGRLGKPFRCLKFRSMRADADQVLKTLLDNDARARAEWAQDFKLRNDPRITKVGRWLRKTSLDELPQLINVIRGEMSLVGPRPIVEAELERYGNCKDLYLQVRPGMTGLWQISGRNDTGYDERVALDAWYVQNWSLWYDLAIMFKTIDVVLNRRGAY